jgi:hypothetical protein
VDSYRTQRVPTEQGDSSHKARVVDSRVESSSGFLSAFEGCRDGDR